MQRHEGALAVLAESLEEWLAGRMKQVALVQKLEGISKTLSSYRGLDSTVFSQVAGLEQKMLDRTLAFAKTDSPDSDGQRALFLSLSELNEKRNLALLGWRSKRVSELLAVDLPSPAHSYFRWEAGWLPLWTEEVRLTGELQRRLLDSGDDSQSNTDILKGLLRLRARAESIAVPDAYAPLNSLSKKRLTLLARTGEQLLRMDERKSRGALTRVRRLSRQLSELTEEFQLRRLAILAAPGFAQK